VISRNANLAAIFIKEFFWQGMKQSNQQFKPFAFVGKKSAD